MHRLELEASASVAVGDGSVGEDVVVQVGSEDLLQGRRDDLDASAVRGDRRRAEDPSVDHQSEHLHLCGDRRREEA